MTPIYFPFSWISKPIADASAVCFGPLTVYVPSENSIPLRLQTLAKSGCISIKCPVKGDDDRINALMRQYKNWLTLHQGTDLSVFLTSNEIAPFYEETSIANIRAELKKQKSQVKDEPPDPLFQARLFLQSALEYDSDHDEIEQSYEAVEQLEDRFLKDLKGEEEIPDFMPVDILPPEDPGAYMTRQRLDAWSRLVQQDSTLSGVYITSSRSVLDAVLDVVPEAKPLCDFDPIPAIEPSDETIRNRFMTAIEESTKSAWNPDRTLPPPPQPPGQEFLLKLFIAPTISPASFLRRIGLQQHLDKKQEIPHDVVNTVFGIISPKK